MSIQGVIFDGDGVVFDSEHLTIEGFIRLLAKRDIHITMDDCGPLIGVDNLHMIDKLRELYNIEIELEAYLEEREVLYREVCLDRGGPEKIKGIDEILGWLDENGIPFGLASGGTPKKIAYNLERTGLAERFAVALSTRDVGKGKPAPDVYIEAARRIGVPIENCLVIEDSLVGIQGGLNAGALTVAMMGSHSAEELRTKTPFVYNDHLEIMADLQDGRFSESLTP